MSTALIAELAIVAILIILDIVSGVLKAAETHTMDSSKLREGLYHKGAYIGVIILAIVVEYGSGFLPLGFNLPLVAPVCVYVAVTEVVSVFENLCQINPELRGSKLAAIFGGKLSDTPKEVPPDDHPTA